MKVSEENCNYQIHNHVISYCKKLLRHVNDSLDLLLSCILAGGLKSAWRCSFSPNPEKANSHETVSVHILSFLLCCNRAGILHLQFFSQNKQVLPLGSPDWLGLCGTAVFLSSPLAGVFETSIWNEDWNVSLQLTKKTTLSCCRRIKNFLPVFTHSCYHHYKQALHFDIFGLWLMLSTKLVVW